ncbi:MAG: hypothetical protein M3R59_05155 [Verrucomicrobiota bacterium]|nr:hypothetical protein [Verrucomicrobiota bacterium]
MPENWLDDCSFESRQETVSRGIAAGVLSPKADQAVAAPTAVVVPPPAPAVATHHSPSAVDAATRASEVHTFRQLAADAYNGEKGPGSWPEYIVFGLIALLAVLWPILAIMGVMSRHH